MTRLKPVVGPMISIFAAFSLVGNYALGALENEGKFCVGDSATFDTVRGEYRVEVVGLRDPDMVGIRQSWRNERPPLESWMVTKEVEQARLGFTRESAAKYFTTCLDVDGVYEKLVTPIGELTVCKIYLDSSHRSFYSLTSEVALGIAQFTESHADGSGILHTISSFEEADCTNRTLAGE